MTEVGVIPEDWKDASLGELAEIRMCKRIFSEQTNPTGDIPFFKIGTFGRAPDAFISGNLYREYKRKYSFPKKGDVLLSAAGTLGKTVIYDGEDAYFQDSNIVWLDIDRTKIKNEYLYQCYQAIKWASPEGSTISRLYNGIIRKTKIPLPPTETEQRAIAQALSDVDALLATLDKMIAKKRDLKQATMQQLLTGEKRLPGFSGDWELASFGDLFDFSGGYSASRDQLSNEGHCYLHYGDIHGSTKTCVNTRRDFLDIPKLSISLGRISEGSLLKHGDVVFVDASEDDAGTSKHLVIENEDDVPFISGLHTIVAKSKTNDLAHAYKHYCFQTPAIRQQFMFYAVGTKVSGISKTNIAKLTLPIPSIPEQIAIAAVLSSMDVELATLEARRDKTRNIKQAMMQELLTGKTRLV